MFSVANRPVPMQCTCFSFLLRFLANNKDGTLVGDKKTTQFELRVNLWIASNLNFLRHLFRMVFKSHLTSFATHAVFLGRIQIWLHFSIDSFVTNTSLLQLGKCRKSLQLPLDPGKTWMEYRISWAPSTSKGGHWLKMRLFLGPSFRTWKADLDWWFHRLNVLRSSEATLLTKHCGK